MSRDNRRSLLQLFSPDDGYVGRFGWLCGYSADAAFLELAAHRFTQATSNQRAQLGKVSLVAMLDQGQPQILPSDAPGVLHAPLRDPRHFSLLHAKVALLGFRHSEDAARWRLRLLVSTGNWTRETVERSLDLVWVADAGSDSLVSRDPEALQVRADITAAWGLMQWLQRHFELGVLSATPNSLTALGVDEFAGWCEAVAAGRLPQPRLFDSRSHSLLRQLPKLVRRHAGEARRNTLILGSGFYEGGVRDSPPRVLTEIIKTLRDAGSVTSTCGVNVIVEPSNCQAIASALPSMRETQGWRVWSPGQPKFLGGKARTLHAKFIFASGCHAKSNNCLNGWLYLGSGNLTTPGFLRACPTGNLEAGVVVSEDGLQWNRGRGGADATWLGSRLPVQWDKELETIHELSPGSDMSDRPPAFRASPIAWCRYLPASPDFPARLELPHHESSLEVLDTESNVCETVTTTEVLWPGAMQPFVVVRWRDGDQVLTGSVPVIDPAGRVAATELRPIDLEEAWWQLQQFPQAPEEGDLLWREDGVAGDFAPGASVSVNASDSAIRAMMRLIENIADKQIRVPRADWNAWCTCLEQVLRQAASCDLVTEFIRLIELDPLVVLGQACSLPSYARPHDSREWERISNVLLSVAMSWEIEGMSMPVAHREKLV